MQLDSLRITAILPAPPARVYAAWLDAKEHAEFTGGDARIEAGVGGAFTAWDGYIAGRHLELVPGERIVQSWRTTEFPEDAADSRLEIRLEPRGAGGGQTTLTLIHTGIPAGQGVMYKGGWGEHYFEPMRAYFEELGAAPTVRGAGVAVAPAARSVTRKAAHAPAEPAKKAAPKGATRAPAKPAKRPAKKATRGASAPEAGGRRRGSSR